MREKYEEIFVELGVGFIERTCQITAEEFIGFVYQDKDLPKHDVISLDFLAEVVKCLEGAYRRMTGDIRKWFYRRRKELGNLSPYQILRRSAGWTSNNERAQKILSLAKSLGDGNAT